MSDSSTDFDLAALDDPDFKEDSVREDITGPLLVRLGYASSGDSKLIRSKSLANRFVMIGTTKRPIAQVPDYLLSVEGKYRWVLDAKAPAETITSGRHVEQAYSYAIHPEIRVELFALCNGREFALFDIRDPSPMMHFKVKDLEDNWRRLRSLLSPQAFRQKRPPTTGPAAQPDFDYLAITPPPEITTFQKQAAKRYHGVHAYFTRQVWSVVQRYIETFTRPGDLILDPFGGSGVTLIEALILGRKAIHIDINPLANFVVETLITKVDLASLVSAFNHIVEQFEARRAKTREQVAAALKRYAYPKGVVLPDNSDVDTVDKLFRPQQLVNLALLKHLIMHVADPPVRAHLLLMFSGLLNKINLTYHASGDRSEGRGDSGVFRYYRYRIAHTSPNLDPMKYFKSRLKKVLSAKEELRPFLSKVNTADYKVLKASATSLDMIASEMVDYIYTDPPYGARIPYLDLSTMWNAWLDLEVTPSDFDLEAIEGGELEKSKSRYSNLLASLTESESRRLRVIRLS